MKVKESKKYYDLIITLEDISRLEAVFEEAFQNDKVKLEGSNLPGYKSVELEKSISFAEDFNVSFKYDVASSRSQMLFELSDMAVRKCQAIDIVFRSTLDDKRSSISIVSGSGFFSRLSVESSADDRQFVAGFLRNVSDVVVSIKPQNVLFRRIAKAFDVVFIVIFVVLIDYFWFSKIFPDFYYSLFNLFTPTKAETSYLKTDDFAIFLSQHPNAIYVATQIWNLACSLVFAMLIPTRLKIDTCPIPAAD